MQLPQEESQGTKLMLKSGNKDPAIMGDPDVGFFTNKHGLKIKTLKWLVKAPIGVVVLLHSLNSHCRFDYLKHNATIVNNDKAVLNDGDNFYVHKDSWIEELNKKGYSVYGLDLQGHGESGCLKGEKTYIKEFDDFADDVLQYMNTIHDSIVNEMANDNHENAKNAIRQKKRCTRCDLILKDESDTCCSDEDQIITKGLHLRQPEQNQYKKPDYNIDPYKTPIPMYLVGLSMGGNIALRILELLSQRKYNYYNRLNIKGACSLSGMVSSKELRKKPSWKYFYIPAMAIASVLFPTSRFMPNVTCEAFPYLKDLYSYDKIFNDQPITNKFAYKLLGAIDNLNKDMDKVLKDVPILFIHSANDQKCNYTDAQEFYNNLKTKKKEFHTIEDMEHMITMEPGNEKVVKKLVDWLEDTQKAPKEKKKKVKKNLRSAADKSTLPNKASPTQGTGVSTDLPKDKAAQEQVSQEQTSQVQTSQVQTSQVQTSQVQTSQVQVSQEQVSQEQVSQEQVSQEQTSEEQAAEEQAAEEQAAEEQTSQA